jgi:CDP-diacylglycerol--glycerol-3-phosphate 3-phosphatidyltransferase
VWPFDRNVAQVGPYLMAAATVVTVVTGVDYVARALRLRRGGLRRGGAHTPSPPP